MNEPDAVKTLGEGAAADATDILLSDDPETIRRWSAECLALGLYREDGIVRHRFAGEGKIYLMAYLPGVAWALYHDPGVSNWIYGSVFVKPECRHQGIGTRIAAFVWEELKKRGGASALLEVKA